jgi:uncharacterized protein YdeI (YjbR/CyaY-like superfamily)
MKPMFFTSPEKFRAWLEDHHETQTELLVGFYKRASRKPSITWPESVDEALCFGWIDGVRRSVSETAYTIRFTPRKPTSTWSTINVARVAELTKLGRMRPAGVRAFSARKAEKTGIYSFERIDAARLTPAQEKTLRANRKAAAFFDAQPPWYRRAAIHWVISAKQEDTRARRLARLIADSAAGRTIPPLTRPIGIKTTKGRAMAPANRASSRTSAKATIPAPSASLAFGNVVAALRGGKGIEEPRPSRRAFGSNALKVNGRIFAMLTGGTFVVKLPEQRVDALVGAGVASYFDPGRGKVMKQWASLQGSEQDWLDLAREALAFVRVGAR